MAGRQYWKRGLKPVLYRWDDAIARMDPLEFERLIAEHYRRQGFRVEHVGTGVAKSRYDGGIDLKLYRDDEYIIVQCKRHTAMQVPHNDVHEFLGIMHTERATGAIFVNSGEYSSAAMDKLQGIANFQMIDGHELRRMIDPLPEAPIPAGDPDARWRPGYANEAEPAVTASQAAVDPELLVFRTPHSESHNPAVQMPAARTWWWLGALLCAVVFLLLIRTLLERIAWSAGGNASSVQSIQPESLPSPSGEAPALMDDPSPGAQPDWDAAPTTHAAPPRPQTAAEIRESQRRADEAIKLLEATTPEM